MARDLRPGGWYPVRRRHTNQGGPPPPPVATGTPSTITLGQKLWAWGGNGPTVTLGGGTGAVATSFSLTAPVSGTWPFTIGLPQFAEGTVPLPLTLNIAQGQVAVVNLWPGGSVRLVTASGHITATAGVAVPINVVESANSGSNLTPLNIQSALGTPGQNVVSLGVNGSVDLASLVATPLAIGTIDGAQMIQRLYGQKVTVGSSALYVQFAVRLYKFGAAEIDVLIDNGWVDLANSNKTYSCAVVIGGSQVSVGGLGVGPRTVTHLAKTRIFATGWVNSVNPALIPQHNLTDMVNSRLVPHFFGDAPPASFPGAGAVGQLLSTVTQTYSYGANGDWGGNNFAGTGWHNQVGWINNWDCLFVTSGDSRAYNSVLANADIMMGTFPMVWRGSSDTAACLPFRPSVYPTASADGAGGGIGTPGITADGVNFWEDAHSGSLGYLAWLLTGKWRFKEAQDFQSGLCWLADQTGGVRGFGVTKTMFPQTRGMAWRLRAWGQMTASAPTGDLLAADYAQVASHQIDVMVATAQAPGQNTRGIAYDNEVLSNPDGTTTFAEGRPWMKDYLGEVVASFIDIKALSNLTNTTTLRNFLAKYTLGRLGDNNNGTVHDFRLAALANSVEGLTANPTDLTGLIDDWTVFQAQNLSHGFNVDDGVANKLQGGGAAAPAGGLAGYWGYLHPFTSRLVDQGVPGAVACYNRILGAVNYLDFRNSVGQADNFGTIPIWGQSPRSSTVTDALTIALAGMTAGTWQAVGTNKWSDVAYAGPLASQIGPPVASNGPDGIPLAWGGSCYDSDNGQMIYWGGGHNNYYGNEVYAFKLSTLTWSLLNTPSDPVGWNGLTFTFPSDGRPISDHTYAQLTYVPGQGMYSSGGINKSGNPTPRWWQFNTTIKVWTEKASDNVVAQYTQIANYNPVDGKVYYTGPGNSTGLRSYNPAANVWTPINTQGANTNGENCGGDIDQSRNTMLVVGFNVLKSINLATGVVTSLAASVTGNTLPLTLNAPGVAWYPGTREFVIWGGGSATTTTGNVWRYNPATNVMSVQAPASGAVPTKPVDKGDGTGTNGTFSRWRYLPFPYNCFILQNAIFDSIYIYKPAF